MMGAFLIVYNIKTAPFFCVCPVFPKIYFMRYFIGSLLFVVLLHCVIMGFAIKSNTI
jgi:hypothetical protein